MSLSSTHTQADERLLRSCKATLKLCEVSFAEQGGYYEPEEEEGEDEMDSTETHEGNASVTAQIEDGDEEDDDDDEEDGDVVMGE